MAVEGEQQEQGQVAVEPLFRAITSRWRPILLTVIVAGLAAYAFAASEPRLYRAEAIIALDIPANASTHALTREIEAVRARSQVDRVAKRLGLLDRPEFAASPNPLLDWLMRMTGRQGAGHDVGEAEALRRVRDRLDVHAVGSDRIAVRFSSQDPRLVAAMPNALAEEYLASFSAPRDDGAMRGAFGGAVDQSGLDAEIRQAQGRLSALEAKTPRAADDADPAPASPEAVALSAARAAKIGAEEHVTRIRKALASQDTAAIAAAVDTPAVDALAEEEERVAASLAELSQTLLDKHPRIRALKAQQADFRERLTAEAQRALTKAVVRARAAAATLAERRAEAEAKEGKGTSPTAPDDPALQDLRAEIASLQQRLEAEQAAAPQATALGERQAVAASIAVRAKVPAHPYTPKTALIVSVACGAALLLAMLIAIGGAIVGGRVGRRAVEPASGEEAEPESPAASPEVTGDMDAGPADAGLDVSEGAVEAAIVEDGGTSAPEPAPGVHAGAEEEDEELSDPDFSVSAAALDLLERGSGRVVCVSPEGDDGSAVSIVLARLVAEQGLRTILIDLTDTAAPTRLMESRPGLAGLTDFLDASVSAAETIQFDCGSPAHFVPRGFARRTDGLEASTDFSGFIEALENAYDVVVMECGRSDARRVRALMPEENAKLIVTTVQPDEDALASTLSDFYRAGLTRFSVMMPGLPARLDDESRAA